MKILIIENDRSLADNLRTVLNSEELESTIAYDGTAGKEYAISGMYDLLILDASLPGGGGCSLARQLRDKHISTPIMMLTENFSRDERIECLNSGVDYCLSIPFDTAELLAGVHALLRRQIFQANDLSFGNTQLDLSSGMLICGEQTVRLSAKELGVMQLLLRNPSHNHSKERILAQVWGYDSNAVENHVEVYVGFLRRKLTQIGSDISIVAIRKLGYHLEVMAGCVSPV